MGKDTPLLLILVAAVCSLLLSSASGERPFSSEPVVRALRHAGAMSERQNFGTCSPSRVASILSGYPSDCQSRLQRLDLLALERGDLNELEDVYDFFCEPRCGQPMVNAFCRCGFEQLGELVVQACSLNAQGQRCTLRTVIEPLTDALTIAEGECLPYSPGSTCSTACKTALEAARDLGGCCVNIYNITRTDVIEIDEYALWASCDVETPGFCGGSSLSTSGNCNELPSSDTPTTRPPTTRPPNRPGVVISGALATAPATGALFTVATILVICITVLF